MSDTPDIQTMQAQGIPWPGLDIRALSLEVYNSAIELMDATAIPSDASDPESEPIHTITYEEAIATIGLAVTQMHATITNSFTAIAMGLDEEGTDD